MAEAEEKEALAADTTQPQEDPGNHVTMSSSLGEIFRFVTPVFGSSILSFGFYFTDVLMIAPRGEVALGAVGQGGMLYGVILTFFFGVLSMYTPLVGNMRPAERRAKASSSFWTAVLLAVLCAGALCALCSAAGPILRLAGQPAETVAHAERYVGVLRWAAIPAHVFNCILQESNRRGRPHIVFFAAVTGNILNALLNWIFIYDPLHLGVPDMEGVALATVLARSLMVVLAMVALERGTPREQRLFRASLMRVDWSFFRAMIRRGAYRGVTDVSDWFAALILMLMIGWSGVVAIAGSQVADVVSSAAHVVPHTFCTLIALVISREIGDGTATRSIKALTFRLLKITFASVGALSLLLLVALRWIPMAFSLSPGTEAYGVARTIMLIHIGFFAIYTLKLTLLASLDAMLDTRVPALLAIVESYVITIPLAYVVTRCGGGAPGVWISEGIGMTIMSVLLGVRLRRMFGSLDARRVHGAAAT